MPFNPSLPNDRGPLSSAIMRTQLNALNDKFSGQVDIIKQDGQHFSILYRGNLPLEWAVQSQGNQGGIWDINKVVAGNQMLVTLTGTPYAVRIVGRDAGHNPVTDVSNVLILNPPAPPTNIVLSYNQSEDNANWTWDGNQPVQWEIQFSTDGGSTWMHDSYLDGAYNNTAPNVEPSLMRIRGVDANNSPISDFSNSVNVG